VSSLLAWAHENDCCVYDVYAGFLIAGDDDYHDDGDRDGDNKR
jgi:hypothetical protein